MSTTTTATVDRRYSTRSTRPADYWRVTDPARFATYVAALSTIHRETFRGARDWLDVEAFIDNGCHLVVRTGGRTASESIRDEALMNPCAMRQQIKELARRLA